LYLLYKEKVEQTVNKKTLSTILVLILLTSMMASVFLGTLNVAKAQSAPTLTITDLNTGSHSQIYIGDTVMLSGTGFSPNTVLNLSSTELGISSQPWVVTDASGSFTIITQLPLPPGHYTLEITDGVNSAELSFTVLPIIILAPTWGPPGSTVYVLGAGFAADSPVTVTFGSETVISSADNVATDDSGNLQANFTVPSNSASATTYAVSVTDGSSNSASANFAVNPSDIVDHFEISAIGAQQVAGVPFSVTITAYDASGQVDTEYSATALLVCMDSQNNSLTSRPVVTLGGFVNGVWTGMITVLTSSDTAQLIVEDYSGLLTGTPIFGISNAFTVAPGAAAFFGVTPSLGYNGVAAVGQPFDVTVTAYDQFGNVATGYAGTVAITSNDSYAVLPQSATLTNGVGTFRVTLVTVGTQTISATDTVDSSITGSTQIQVENNYFAVFGYVYYPDGTTPVVNAGVFIGNNNGWGTGTQTDQNGFYSLAVPAGTYNFNVNPPSGSGFVNYQTTLDVTGNMQLNVTLQAGLVVSGYVLAPNGMGVANAWVKLGNNAGYGTGTLTDETGYYFVGVSPGTYKF